MAEKQSEKKAEKVAESREDAEKATPIVGTDNPEGIDLSKGDKDAATAYEPEEK